MATLDGKIALVTGGSRGIGRAIALELARRGADVAVNYVRQAEAAAQVVAEIEALGRRALAVVADVGEAIPTAQMVETVLRTFGRVDILVNNAGITRDMLLMRMSEEEWDEVIRINLKGAFNACKAVTRTMLKQRSGRIINITSISGLMGQVGQANYSASKAGLIGLTKSLARELGPKGITVNAIAPGYIPTELTASLAPEWQARLLEMTPLGRLGTVDDVAHAVAFFASDDAAFITGAVLAVDGGLSM